MPPSFLQRVLDAYPAIYAARDWESFGTSAGFSGAVIIRLETTAGLFCLRGWPINSFPARRLLGLHRLLAHVFEAGVSQVAVPVRSRDGETLVSDQNQLWQLEPWMPGQADFWSAPTPKRLQNTMALLAKFHQATETYTDAGPARSWLDHEDQTASPTVSQRLAILHDWQSEKLARLRHALPAITDAKLHNLSVEMVSRFERVAAIVGHQLELCLRMRFRLQPCLRDVWHDHVLFSGEEVSGLIDPAATRTENIAADLSRLLGSFLGDDSPRWEEALSEYETHRPLEPEERALITALDQSGVLLSGMTWLDRLILQRESPSNRLQVLERLETLASRLKTLDERISKTLW